MSNELKAMVVVKKPVQRDALKRPLVVLQEVPQGAVEPLDPPVSSQIDLSGNNQTTKCAPLLIVKKCARGTPSSNHSLGQIPTVKPITASGTDQKTGQNQP